VISFTLIDGHHIPADAPGSFVREWNRSGGDSADHYWQARVAAFVQTHLNLSANDVPPLIHGEDLAQS
jgi:hypothetical protein